MLMEEHLDCLIEPNQVVELGTSVPGVVDRVLVERADTIVSGQPLVRLESSVEQATLRHAEERAAMDGTIKAHRADMNLARQNLKRIEKLFERQAISSQQRDEALAEYEVARRNYQVAKENQQLARLEFETHQAKLERRIIRSPIDGVVIERLSVPGEFVDERPLLTLAQLDPLRVEVLIPATLFGSIQPGMSADINPEVPVDGDLRANVVTVDRLIDSASGTFRVSLELPNPGQRIPGGLKCGVRFLPRVADSEPAPEVDANKTKTVALPEPSLPRPGEIPVVAAHLQSTQETERELKPEQPEQPRPEPQSTVMTAPIEPDVLTGVEAETFAAIDHTSDVAEPASLPPVAFDPVATTDPLPEMVKKAENSAQPEPIELTTDDTEADQPSSEVVDPVAITKPLPARTEEMDTKVQPEPVALASETNDKELLPLPAKAPLIEAVAANKPLPAQREEADRVVQPEPVDVQPVRWCGSLRTSTSANATKRHIKKLRAADIDVSHDEFVSSVPRDFVVEMPLESGSCKEMLGQLKTAGFPDVACYRSKKSNRWIVSGGLFKKEKYARTRQQEMAAKGFDVELRTRYKTRQSQTFYLEADSQSLVAETLDKLQLDSGAQLKETPCGSDALARR